MKRTTIFADDETLRALEQMARAEGVSLAAIVRRALAAYIARRRPPLSFVSIGDSKRGDIAERAEELLRAGFAR
ncbi:MAG: CopG family transcriptional regulator [Chloroflexi bacterium]|nr:CopG family transcriptional regulator [Chloroflexota bacterium]